MTMDERLEGINERIFSDALYGSIRAVCDEADEKDEVQAEFANAYKKAKEALPGILNEEQLAMVEEAERRRLQDEEWGMRFAFMRGLYAGFEHYFTHNPGRNIQEACVGPASMRRECAVPYRLL